MISQDRLGKAMRDQIDRNESLRQAFEDMGRDIISAAMAAKALSTALTKVANSRRKKKVRGYKRREKWQIK